MKPMFRATRLLAALKLCVATTRAASAQTLRIAVTNIVGLENLQREYAPLQKTLPRTSNRWVTGKPGKERSSIGRL